MVNYREILRLTRFGYTQRQIAASVHSSRSTISEVQELARKADLSFPLDESVTNEVLLMTFHPERLTATNPRVEPDYMSNQGLIEYSVVAEPPNLLE